MGVEALKTLWCLIGLVVALGGHLRGESGLSWKQEPGTLALRRNSEVVWQLNFRTEEGKPYFHPLRTMNGEVITDLRPGDHPWHRGLWFSWKLINGINYWEENPTTGKSEGISELVSSEVETRADFSARITMKLSYHPPGKAEILSEERLIEVSAPDPSGDYRMDWSSKFHATASAELSRTPLPEEAGGKAWGGYAGLSLRLAKSLKGGVFSSDRIAPGERDKKAHGSRSNWFAFTLPGGKRGGIAIFNAGTNPPTTRWYITPEMPFLSPAVLWQKPFRLAKGDSLSLKYRVLVFNSAAGRSRLTEEWKRISKKSLAAVDAEMPQQNSRKGWTSLFNGKDLEGWKFHLGKKSDENNGTFTVKDGILICSGKPYGYMYTPKSYSKFTLEFELAFKRPAGLEKDSKFRGNSGCLIHIGKKNALGVWPRSIEVQGMNRSMGLILPIPRNVKCTRTFDGKALARVIKPLGEFNKFEIEVDGGDMVIKINGKIISTVGDCELTEGPIGFQSEGVETHWKNIRIREKL